METYRTLEDLHALESGEKEDYEEAMRRKLAVIRAAEKVWRARNTYRDRLKWEQRVGELTDAEFRRIFWMSRESFGVILSRVRERIKKDERRALNGACGVVPPELRLAMMLRFLAGASYLDIGWVYGVHRSTLYAVIWETIEVINETLSLVFDASDETQMISLADGFMKRGRVGSHLYGCVGALDGICVKIARPSRSSCKNSMDYCNM